MTIRKFSVLMFVFALITLVVSLSGCEKAMEMMPDDQTPGITIGVAVAETGDNAVPYGLPMLRGLELAQEQLNMAGANIMFERVDNMSTLDGSKAAIQALVDAGVPAIIGVGISTQLKEAFPIAQAAGVVALSPISSAAGLSGEVGDYAFRVGLATNILIPRGVMQTHAALDYDTAAIIYDSADTYSTSVKDELEKALMEAGVTISATEMFVTADIDFTMQLDAINTDSPDVLFVAALSTQMVQIIMQAGDHAIASRLIVPDLTSGEVMAASDAAENAIAFAGWSELDESP
ncbi:ABC transporter substrate-binding protein, partial [Candidatus Poribacteria bacterium]|nr:ABC transporter substrate-binding protein [Candidatus Poribacteria bacterium]